MIAVTREQWAAIAAALVAAGQPWPEAAVEVDLAFWGEGRPGRPALQRRWGWAERATRRRIERRST